MPLFYAFLCVFAVQTPTKCDYHDDSLGDKIDLCKYNFWRKLQCLASFRQRYSCFL